MGIKPTSIAWKAIVLSLNYGCAGAGRETRTLTKIKLHRILSPGRLPIPPLQLSGSFATENSSVKKLVTRLGFEPRTLRLKGECSTAELASQNWLG